MSKYYEWENLKYIYLEDSYVLGIEESETEISFTIEAVLTEEHPMYSPPGPEFQYCYKRARIVFKGLKNVKWKKRNLRPFTDANGDIDYGNIDSFELLPDGYHLEGDWGEVIICSEPPIFDWI